MYLTWRGNLFRNTLRGRVSWEFFIIHLKTNFTRKIALALQQPICYHFSIFLSLSLASLRAKLFTERGRGSSYNLQLYNRLVSMGVFFFFFFLFFEPSIWFHGTQAKRFPTIAGKRSTRNKVGCSHAGNGIRLTYLKKKRRLN